METIFLSITEKAALTVSLQVGDAEAIKAVMHELNRLESVIRDYEIGMRQINEKFSSKTFKDPKNYRNGWNETGV